MLLYCNNYGNLTTLNITPVLLFTTSFLLALPFITTNLCLRTGSKVVPSLELALPIQFAGTRQIFNGSTVFSQKGMSMNKIQLMANWQQ